MNEIKFQQIFKNENPTNIFEEYQNEFIDLLNNRFSNDDIGFQIVEGILSTIEIIKETVPREPSYSNLTKEVIRVISDLLSISYAPFVNNNSKSLDKLKLALIYLKSTLPIVKLSIIDAEKFSYKSYLILFDAFNKGLDNYISKTKSEVDSAIVYIIKNNPLYKLTIDDEIFLNQFIEQKLNQSLRIWDLKFEFKTTDHKALNLMYLFIEFLQIYVPKEDVFIIQLSKGSIKSRVKAFFKSKEIEQEVIEGIRDVKKYAKGKLTKEFEESEKIKKESEILDLEKKIQEQKIQENEYNLSKNKAKIELKKLQLETERLSLENEQLRIRNLKSKFELLKQLLGDSIISQNEFKIYLNDTLLLKKVNHRQGKEKYLNEEE